MARLFISDDRRWVCDMRVLDIYNRGFSEAVNATMLGTKKNIIICEKYQARQQGHNTFDGLWTSQLIGGLRYVAESDGSVWHTVPPGDPNRHLKAMGLERYIEKWQSLCPKPNHANWHHARSAWRVLAQHLLNTYPEFLATLMKKSTFRSFMPVITEAHIPLGQGCLDLIAPAVTWGPKPRIR